MKKLLSLIIVMVVGFTLYNQINAQQFHEGEYVFYLNDQLVRDAATWQTTLPTKYHPIYIKIKAYKVVKGNLVQIPWDVEPHSGPELNKTKVDNNTLKISFKQNNGNWGCSVGIMIERDTGDLAGFRFWVNLPPDSY